MNKNPRPYTTRNPNFQSTWPVLRPILHILPTAYLLLLRTVKKQTPDKLYLTQDSPNQPYTAHIFLYKYILRIFYLPKHRAWIFSFMWERGRVQNRVLRSDSTVTEYLSYMYQDYGQDTFFLHNGKWFYTPEPAEQVQYAMDGTAKLPAKQVKHMSRILSRPILCHPEPVEYLIAEPFQAPEQAKQGKKALGIRGLGKYIYDRIFRMTTTII